MARILDYVFFIFFLLQIPCTAFMDIQVIVPSKFFPKQIIGIKEWYCSTFRDPLMSDPPVWFQSLMYCELLFQWPFFYVATYGYYKGAAKCNWLKIPAIIYSVRAITAMIVIQAHVLFQDFSDVKIPAPRNVEERLRLIAVYLPFFIMPIVVLMDAILSPEYSASVKNKNNESDRNQPKKYKAH